VARESRITENQSREINCNLITTTNNHHRNQTSATPNSNTAITTQNTTSPPLNTTSPSPNTTTILSHTHSCQNRPSPKRKPAVRRQPRTHYILKKMERKNKNETQYTQH
jgi:hypothetical protein